MSFAWNTVSFIIKAFLKVDMGESSHIFLMTRIKLWCACVCVFGGGVNAVLWTATKATASHLHYVGNMYRLRTIPIKRISARSAFFKKIKDNER